MINPIQRIMTLEQAVKWRHSLKLQGKRLVVTNGCFDILHRGHAQYLYQAKLRGDKLLVLQNSDESVRRLKSPSRPVINENNRAYMLASLESVDAVVTFYDKRCTKEFTALQPEVYVKGGDYTLETLNPEERKALQQCEAKFHFIPFIKGFSTSDIIKKIKEG